MIKKCAMSVLGYAIVLVIILGVVMIISAPMIVDKHKQDSDQNMVNNIPQYDNRNRDNYMTPRDYKEIRNSYNSSDSSNQVELVSELRRVENNLSSRIDSIERAQNDLLRNQASRVSDKYECTIEGNMDANGNIVPITSENSALENQKFVFVCEYVK